METNLSEIELIETTSDLKKVSCELIKGFWKEHNNIEQSDEDAGLDYEDWTNEGHKLFLIKKQSNFIGFAHMGNRGAEVDWLEDLFILKEYQRKGIGSFVIRKLEEIVKSYSKSLYIEVAARNLKALKLYYELGYDCLNTITIRKDFNGEDFSIIQKENIGGFIFEIKKYNK
ncbi:TPA: GNAT family N-acetyltransferase [Streptococcus suis]|nr:GNAT family N-acetyltransferase [Streptococcus suis]HEM3598976.1 GNAT family N-acetyltransferase [Streptococcus suis]HEM3607099.1 GNAT family N-acetyltransferase [Streptococcus suis]HEM3608991.1 GNAT family N-acetyltransferase [Streptococcus suis]HEM3645459.1 GNAT family N-acetyltransferase [Streptococcus suis]